MSKLDDLKAALAASEATTDTGFQSLSDALAELASDINGLNDQIQNPPVEGVTAQLQTDSQAAADKFNAVAQAIKDAIATPAPVE